MKLSCAGGLHLGGNPDYFPFNNINIYAVNYIEVVMCVT